MENIQYRSISSYSYGKNSNVKLWERDFINRRFPIIQILGFSAEVDNIKLISLYTEELPS